MLRNLPKVPQPDSSRENQDPESVCSEAVIFLLQHVSSKESLASSGQLFHICSLFRLRPPPLGKLGLGCVILTADMGKLRHRGSAHLV